MFISNYCIQMLSHNKCHIYSIKYLYNYVHFDANMRKENVALEPVKVQIK